MVDDLAAYAYAMNNSEWITGQVEIKREPASGNEEYVHYPFTFKGQKWVAIFHTDTGLVDVHLK